MNGLFHANILFLRGRHKEAFDEYIKVARDHQDPLAAANLGYMYHRGIGVVRSYELARAYYQSGSLGDGGVGFFNLALMHLRGEGVAVDFKRAIEYMKSSASAGCADAQLYLGLAYILGYAYDPIEIECITLIPFYKVIYRDESTPLIVGNGYDPFIEHGRYDAIEADGDSAVSMYSTLISQHADDVYTERQLGAARYMLGKACIEGLGDAYDPKRGYKLMYLAAIYDECAEAAVFLLENAEAARTYKVDVGRVEMLMGYGYFRPSMGNLGNPREHRVPLLIPEGN